MWSLLRKTKIQSIKTPKSLTFSYKLFSDNIQISKLATFKKKPHFQSFTGLHIQGAKWKNNAHKLILAKSDKTK